MIVVNFKTYPEATGYKAVELARICKVVADQSGVRIVAVPQLVDLAACVETGVDCWAQHVDGVDRGKFTGWVEVEAVQEAGAKGTLLNHAEHKLESETLQKTMAMIGDLAFETCICCAGMDELKGMVPRGPDFVAYEPPELIGSTDKTVTTEKPEIIAQAVQAAGQIPVLVGAGVHTVEDIRTSVRLGAKGVLLATGVVLAADPEAALRELAQGFQN